MPAYDSLPPVSDFIRRHGLNALKSLGQNFILDLNLTDRIARQVPDIKGSLVCEVGAGPASLTRALLKNGAAKVVAVEFDRRAVGVLEEVAAAFPGRLEVIQADALKVDYEKLAKAAAADGLDFRICANLPYNISVPLLLEWLYCGQAIASQTLMFQREVGERIVARPRSKDYSRLSILAQTMTRPKILFDVARTSFTPQPRVNSCIVQLTARPDAPDEATLEKLEIIAKEAFSERRKMIRTTLAPYVDELMKLGIPLSARAEEISPEKFLALARAV